MSTVSKVTCPECSTVLRPAKPLAVGKKVKCPKCANLFTATAEEPEPVGVKPEGASAKKTAPGPAAKKAAAKKEADAKPATKKPEAKKKDDDDEDGGGTYGVIKGEETQEEEEEKKPKINYAPDMSIKDLRGPAQAQVMRPSNALIVTGIAGFIGWLILLVMLLIARYLPVRADPPEGQTGDTNRPMAIIGPGFAAAAPKAEGGRMGMPGMPGGGGATLEGPPKPNPKNVKEEPTFFELFSVQLMPFADEGTYFFVAVLCFIVPGFIYSGALTYGGVQMQNMESRGWGIASSILAMVPLFNSGGLLVVVLMLIQVLLLLFLDEFWWVAFFLLLGLCVQWLLSLATGIWALIVCNSEDVIAGFEYDPDT